MIYLSKYSTVCTTDTQLISDIPWPQRAHIIPSTYKRLKSGMVYPPHKLVDLLNLAEISDYMDANPVKGRTGFILAAGNQGWMGTDGRYDRNPEAELYYECKVPFITLTNIYAGRIASILGAGDHVSTDASACASSLKVLMEVWNLIHNFEFGRVIVLTVEDAVSNSSLEFFGEAGACLTLENEAKWKPSAFDETNQGFYVGQGAAIAVFESGDQNAEAQLLGTYTSAESYDNPLGQRNDGQGYVKAIQGALTLAKLAPDSVKLVKTHGTGTPVNNVAEKTALESTLCSFKATSYKQRIGHTVGASGLLETCLLLDDLKKGEVPAIPNRTTDDPVFLSRPAPAPKGAFLSLAAGMGNVYSAALFTTGT